MEDLLNIIRDSLVSIIQPRFYETERGFQGAFLTELNRRFPELYWDGATIEQEYQKRMQEHGIRIRPDIIIHVPFDNRRFNSRREGNFVVFELKLNADREGALQDYENLSNMCNILGYPLGIFININSTNTYLDEYHGPHAESLRAFAVRLQDNRVEIIDENAA